MYRILAVVTLIFCVTHSTQSWADIQVQGYLNQASLENLASDPSCVPATTCPDGRIYWNTTASEPRMWDGAAWQQILIGASAVPDPLLLGDGTAGAPTYSFTNDSGIGLYRRNSLHLGLTGSLVHDSNAIGYSSAQRTPNTESTGFDTLRLISGGMNTSSTYTPALVFGSDDSDLSCPSQGCALAMIQGRAQETYGAPSAGDMSIEFLTKNGNQGNNNTFQTSMRLLSSGQLLVPNVGISSGSSAASDALKWDVRTGSLTAGSTSSFTVPSGILLGAWGVTDDNSGFTDPTILSDTSFIRTQPGTSANSIRLNNTEPTTQYYRLVLMYQ